MRRCPQLGFLPGEPNHQGPNRRRNRRSTARGCVNSRIRPTPSHQFTKPAQQRRRTDDPAPPQRPRQHTRQRGQRHPILRLQPRPTDLPTAARSPRAATRAAPRPSRPHHGHAAPAATTPSAQAHTRSTTTPKRSGRTPEPRLFSPTGTSSTRASSRAPCRWRGGRIRRPPRRRRMAARSSRQYPPLPAARGQHCVRQQPIPPPPVQRAAVHPQQRRRLPRPQPPLLIDPPRHRLRRSGHQQPGRRQPSPPSRPDPPGHRTGRQPHDRRHRGCRPPGLGEHRHQPPSRHPRHLPLRTSGLRFHPPGDGQRTHNLSGQIRGRRHSLQYLQTTRYKPLRLCDRSCEQCLKPVDELGRDAGAYLPE